MTNEKPYKMLSIAKEKGWGDLANNAAAYILHPKLGFIKMGYGALKDTWKSFSESLLDKPQLTLTWKRGIDNLKKGNFEAATNDFSELKSSIEESTKNTPTHLSQKPKT